MTSIILGRTALICCCSSQTKCLQTRDRFVSTLGWSVISCRKIYPFSFGAKTRDRNLLLQANFVNSKNKPWAYIMQTAIVALLPLENAYRIKQADFISEGVWYMKCTRKFLFFSNFCMNSLTVQQETCHWSLLPKCMVEYFSTKVISWWNMDAQWGINIYTPCQALHTDAQKETLKRQTHCRSHPDPEQDLNNPSRHVLCDSGLLEDQNTSTTQDYTIQLTEKKIENRPCPKYSASPKNVSGKASLTT